jgi:anti-sigma regulatory factor (Ser/Thr protein kinase)
VNATELKRVLSNLINNSIEAFPDGKGRVTVGIRGYKDVVQIIISDNGKGIPASVLAKLGERGVSHGKESSGTSGSGLGVYHAKSTVEKYGGKFEIQSREGQGTMIQIQLPRAVAPEWFVEELRFKPGMTVFSLDDDQSIHGIWQGRLEAENANHHKIEFHRYTSVRSFMDSYLELNPEVRSQALFLIDYEFLNQSLNGLEIIQKLGIAKQSILVTSHASRLEIQNQCVALGVKLLPKELSNVIPIKVE